MHIVPNLDIRKEISAIACRASSAISGKAREISSDWKQLSERKLFVFLLMFIPAMLFTLYVGAYKQPIENMEYTQILIVDADNSQMSAAIVQSLMKTNLYQFKKASLEPATELVRDGEEYAALVIPEGFGEKLENGQNPKLTLLVNDRTSYVVSRLIMTAIPTYVLKLNENLLQVQKESAMEGMGAASDQAGVSSSLLAGAAQGSSALAQGAEQAGEGAQKIADYAGETTSGTYEIARGTRYLGYSAYNLQQGLGQLKEGAQSAQTAIGQISSGSDTVLGAHATLDQLITLAQAQAASLNGSANATPLLTTLASAKAVSTAEKSGITQINAGSKQLYSKSGELVSGIASAENGAAQMEYQLFKAYDAALVDADAQQSLSTGAQSLASAQGEIAEGQQKVTAGAKLVSSKDEMLAQALGEGESQLASAQEIGLDIKEYGKSDYGTFFATAFAVLGLFFGSASAYVFSCLSKVKNAFFFSSVLSVSQGIALLGVYWWMGFPYLGGLAMLFGIFAIVAVLFVALTRAIVALVSNPFSYEHMQIMSPVLSLLAVFMISSGGAIWPAHTLEAPFSSFAPYIPFYYAVAAVRDSALGGIIPWANMAYMGAFMIIFFAVGKLAITRWERIARKKKEAKKGKKALSA